MFDEIDSKQQAGLLLNDPKGKNKIFVVSFVADESQFDFYSCTIDEKLQRAMKG